MDADKRKTWRAPDLRWHRERDVSKLEGVELDLAVAVATGVPREVAEHLPIGTGEWAFSAD